MILLPANLGYKGGGEEGRKGRREGGRGRGTQITWGGLPMRLPYKEKVGY